ncbi:extracellular solute-binding protein [Fictibacillus enclensis]|uniref:extracellular solute-binding protein n=1 Tax=Fictibacillus enclensis TaxID=1017270 RepID=UPI0025A0D280|nr:extracellular solute-binding protein [Fictibacillus enclensis]MDM5200854.1 extracellular solute-binding protein [Fictibacillus enclensis]
MSKRLRARAFLVVSALMLVLMSACSDNGEKASGNGSGDKIELTFWNIWTDPSPQNKASLKAVKKFEKEHPNIVIKQQNIPHDQFKVKVKTQAAGKQLPDLVQVWPGAELTPLVNGKLIQPLNSILSHWDGLIKKNQLTDYNVDGKQYALPANVTPTSLVYYNKKMLAKAGYKEFPKTYEDFKTLIKKLKKQDVIPITLGNKAQWVLQSSYISMIGDRMTGSDFLPDVLDGKKKFTDPEFVKAVGVIKELADMKAFNDDFNSIDNIQHRDLFVMGDAAMMIDGAWSLGPVLEAMDDDSNMGIALFPSIDGGKGNPEAVSAVTGTGIALNSKLKGEKLKAAQAFLKSFYSKDYYTDLMKADILVPADIDPPKGVSPALKRVSELTGDHIAPVYDATLPVDATDVINSGLQEVTLGQMTPEQLAKKLQAAVDKEK